MTQETPLGIIAGSGALPITLLKRVQRPVVVVALEGEVSPAELSKIRELQAVATYDVWQFAAVARYFLQHNVREIVMVGGVRRVGLFSRIRFDLCTLRFLWDVWRARTDNVMLTAVTKMFARRGIAVIGVHEFLPELLAPQGQLTRRGLSATEEASATLGWRVAEELGRADIGQACIIEGGTVVAREGQRGTAAMIKGVHCQAGVVVKRVKPQQDRRVDLPTVGPATVLQMAGAGCTALVIEAGVTLMIDTEEMTRLADERGIAILGW